MTCLICRKAEIVESFTTVEFKRDEFKLVVNEVPARICPSCGEAYVDENVAAQLLTIARQKSEAGMLDAQCQYDTI
jgi:YgiT-type zinc finger domain-containing protein